MNSKTTAYFFIAFIGMLVWNAFLIKRDDAMYKQYYRQQAMENLKKPPSIEIK